MKFNISYALIGLIIVIVIAYVLIFSGVKTAGSGSATTTTIPQT